MISSLCARTLASWLCDGEELALLDVREAGEFGNGHLLFAVPLAYSCLERELPRRVPHPHTRIVLCDDGKSGVAERAASRAAAMGYTRVHVLTGGTASWTATGRQLFQGVHVPSKAFGELVEEHHKTPSIAAADLAARLDAGEAIVVLDGRPLSEYRKMNIPGARCCPNGELALRLASVAPNPKTVVVVNCAGRTRSIIGAQTLVEVGVPNPVYALENGTQGWALAGLSLEYGSQGSYPEAAPQDALRGVRAHAGELARRHGVRQIGIDEASSWLADTQRTTCLLDVRTAEEVAEGTLPSAQHAPGGQLIQGTDVFLAVRGCRVLLWDTDGIRAPLAAQWLRRMGWDAHVLVLQGGGDTLPAAAAPLCVSLPHVPTIDTTMLPDWMAAGACVVDLRVSLEYRRGHVPGSIWSIRPRLGRDVPPDATHVVLVTEDESAARMAATELDREAGGPPEVVRLSGSVADWRAAGLLSKVTPDTPSDSEAIDYLFFVHDRHDGNLDAARRYLAWECGLVAMLHPDERACFHP